MGIKTTNLIWMDGKFVKWKNAKVHILTHALHYGSSVFEGIHSYKAENGTAIFRLDEHIDRLFLSAGAMSMKPKFTKTRLKQAVKNLIKINRAGDAYIRPLAYYGYGNIGVYPKNVPTNIALITLPWERYYSKNLKVMTSKYVRHSEKETVYGTKIGGNYANSILAMHEARKKGYDEALMLDDDNLVAEGPAENIFVVKNKTLLTPSSRSALPGITRKSIIEISRDMGLKAYEGKITLEQVRGADEAFFCGTATEVAPIASIDSRKIGNGRIGEITAKIKEKYYDAVRGKDRKYRKWLTYVRF
jgi:branched-chain amino acid aminotransferase